MNLESLPFRKSSRSKEALTRSARSARAADHIGDGELKQVE